MVTIGHQKASLTKVCIVVLVMTIDLAEIK